MNKNIGIITEQGFVEGKGLGWNPISEKSLNNSSDKKKRKTESDEKSNNKDSKK